jgi:uncharacterized membrane protein YdjX (TVP38/TMEM64 family)
MAMIKLEKKTILRFAVLACVVIGLSILVYKTGLFEFFMDKHRVLHFINQHRSYAAFIFIGLQAIQVVAAPIPGEMTGFVGGMFFGKFWGIVYSTIGLTLGSWLAFGLARVVGRPLVEVAVKPDVINRYDYVMKHKGMFLSFLMFLIPGFPKDFLCYLLGLGHMSQRDFLIVSTSGRLLGTILLTVGGSFLGDKHYGAFFTVAGIGIAMVLLAMIYRERIERWFRLLRAAHRIKSMAERRRLKKKMSKDRGNREINPDKPELKGRN